MQIKKSIRRLRDPRLESRLLQRNLTISLEMCDISLLKLGKVEKLLFNRYRVFVGNDEKVLSKESGDGYTTL